MMLMMRVFAVNTGLALRSRTASAISGALRGSRGCFLGMGSGPMGSLDEAFEGGIMLA
jgi:hypothetical protein